MARAQQLLMPKIGLTMTEGTLVFEKTGSVSVHFMVEVDDTAPKEEGAPKS